MGLGRLQFLYEDQDPLKVEVEVEKVGYIIEELEKQVRTALREPAIGRHQDGTVSATG